MAVGSDDDEDDDVSGDDDDGAFAADGAERDDDDEEEEEEEDEELRAMKAAGEAPFYDEGLDEDDERECDAARGPAGRRSDALLSCAACFEVLAVCCRRLEYSGARGARGRRPTGEYVARIEHVRNCRLDGEEGGSDGEEGGERPESGASAPTTADAGYCCRSCGMRVGRGFRSRRANEREELFVIFGAGGVLPSET